MASIQSGYSQETGARCNEVEGYYTDEEISLQAQGVMDWIREEVTQLDQFEEMFKFDRDGLRKVTNQKVTTQNPEYSGFTTPITTQRQFYSSTQKPPIPPELFVDVIEFDPEDYYDPDLWPELEKYIPDYAPLVY